MNRSAHPVEREEVMAYLDGELEPERAITLTAHLKECAACRALAAELGSVSDRLLAWHIEPAPAGLTERVIAAAAKGGPLGKSATGGRTPKASWLHLAASRPWVWAAAGALAVLLLVISFSAPLGRAPHTPVQTKEPALVLSPDLESARVLRGGGENKNAVTFGQAAPTDALQQRPKTRAAVESAEQPTGPMIVQTASLTIVAQKFETARAVVEQIVSAHQGYVAQLSVSQLPGTARTLSAILRVPANQLEATLAELRKLGSVEQESRSAEDVSRQYVDLVARLKNARTTELQLLQILRQRTGRVRDVLEVEEEVSRVREEIEQMEAERQNLERKVNYATINLRLSEEYHAELGAPRTSIRTRLWNALADGYHTGVESVLALLLFLLSYGPALFFWALILFWPARFAWRRWRAARTTQSSPGGL